MKAHFAYAGGLGGTEHGVEVGFVAMHPAIGQQAQDVQGVLAGGGKGLGQHCITGKGVGFDVEVDAADVLLHHAPRPNVQMPHFGVTKLPFGQPHRVLGGFDGGVRMGSTQCLPIGHFGVQNGVIVAFGTVTKAI